MKHMSVYKLSIQNNWKTNKEKLQPCNKKSTCEQSNQKSNENVPKANHSKYTLLCKHRHV